MPIGASFLYMNSIIEVATRKIGVKIRRSTPNTIKLTALPVLMEAITDGIL